MTIDNNIIKKRIIVAMSGGVDSSVVAAMLKEQGHEVIGITLQLYDQSVPVEGGKTCCAGQDIYDAKMVCQQLDIAHYVLDYESSFKQEVIDDFVDSYLRGETPIPCVKCNQTVKFRDLLKFAKKLNADYLATGHYIQKIFNPKTKKNELHKGYSKIKDQSYFLFSTTQEQLDYLLFPLGGYDKSYTRQLAKKYNLKIAEKSDSQNICFVPGGDYRKVIINHTKEAVKKGDLMHIDGFKLGEHTGIINYTIGQRRGLGVAYGTPLYVIKIDPENNIVYLGGEKHLETTKFIINNINWMGDDLDLENTELSVKIRSTTEPIMAKLVFLCKDKQAQSEYNDKVEYIEVKLLQAEKGVSPGQACVIYHDQRMIGGGFIIRD